MPRISDTTTYPKETTATIDDYLIGTDAVTLNTKTFTIGELKETIEGSAGDAPLTLSIGLSPSNEYMYTINNTTADKPATLLLSSVSTTNASILASPRTSADYMVVASTGGIQFYTGSNLDNQAPTGLALSIRESNNVVVISKTTGQTIPFNQVNDLTGYNEFVIGDTGANHNKSRVTIGALDNNNTQGIQIASQSANEDIDYIQMGQITGIGSTTHGIIKYGSAPNTGINGTGYATDDFAIISNGSTPKDIHISGSTNANTLTVKGNQPRVGINQTAPGYTLDVGGAIHTYAATGSTGQIIIGKHGSATSGGSSANLTLLASPFATNEISHRIGFDIISGIYTGITGSHDGWDSNIQGANSNPSPQLVIEWVSTGLKYYSTAASGTSFASFNVPIEIHQQTSVNSENYNNLYLQGNIYVGGRSNSYKHSHLVMQEDGNSIDFSITSGPTGASAASTNSKLTDYQEGTWAAVLNGTNVSASAQTGYWTKIGRKVTLTIYIDAQHATPSSTATLDYITGIPFAANSQQAFYAGSLGYIDNIFNGDGNDVIQCYLQQSNGRIYIDHKTISSSPGADTATGFDFENNSTGDGKVTVAFELTYFV